MQRATLNDFMSFFKGFWDIWYYLAKFVATYG